MKRILSVLLALTLVFSGIIVSSAVSGNELTLGSETRCTYNGETLVFTFTPTEEVSAMLYTKDASEGADTSVTVFRSDSEDVYGSADDNDDYYNFCYTETFEVGYTYTFEINDFFGAECEFTLVFEEFPVDSIKVTNIPVITCDFLGNYAYDYTGITVTINFKDPERQSQVIESNGSNCFDVDGYELSLEYEEQGDGLLYLRVNYMGLSEYFEAEVEKKNVTGFEILTPPRSTVLYKDIDCIEATYYDEENYEFIEYYSYDVPMYGMSVRITYDDDSFVDIGYEDDPIGFSSFENDLFTQAKDPWDIGKHTVTFSVSGFSDTFEVEVVENPYVRSEITKEPCVTESLFKTNGSGSYDQNLTPFFYYETPLTGIEVTLTDKDGKTTVIGDEISVLLKLTAESYQETDPWDVGEHEVEVYYGRMLVGTYTYTVSDMYISELSFVNAASGAFYYVNSDTFEFIPEGSSVKVTLTNGTVTENVVIPYEEIGVTALGYAVSVNCDYDYEENNYYYYAYESNHEVFTEPVYFDIVTNDVLSIEITNPPKSFTYVNGYGIDIFSTDLSGLEVTVTTSDNEEYIWSWDESDKSGNDIFLDGLMTVVEDSECITVSYRGLMTDYYPETFKDISEYSKGVISKNTTLELDLSRPELCVYTFTPWDDGIYNFTVEGEPITILGIFGEYSDLIYANLYEEQFITNIENETFSIQCYAGQTYYLLVEKFDLFGPTLDSEIDFTVDHEMIGDLDGDCKLTPKDVLMLRKSLGGVLTLTEEQKAVADCDGDGKITPKDVLCIRKYLGGVITSLPYIEG